MSTTQKQPLGNWHTQVDVIPFQRSIRGQKTSAKPLPLAGARRATPRSGPHPATASHGLADPTQPMWPFANALDVTVWHFTNSFHGVWVPAKQHVKKEMKVSFPSSGLFMPVKNQGKQNKAKKKTKVEKIKCSPG